MALTLRCRGWSGSSRRLGNGEGMESRSGSEKPSQPGCCGKQKEETGSWTPPPPHLSAGVLGQPIASSLAPKKGAARQDFTRLQKACGRGGEYTIAPTVRSRMSKCPFQVDPACVVQSLKPARHFVSTLSPRYGRDCLSVYYMYIRLHFLFKRHDVVWDSLDEHFFPRETYLAHQSL